MGKPTIYRWWSSKSALIADALLEGLLAPPGPLPTDTGDLRRDLLAWLEPTLRITAAEESTSLSRSLIAAAAEDAVVGDRLDAANPAYHALSTRLSAAKARGELDDDTDIDVVVDVLVGAVVMRMLRRASYREGEAAALIDAVIPRS